MPTAQIITQRERQILDSLCQGWTAKEIGAQLHISRYTVESHRRNLILKYGVRNTAQLVAKEVRKEYE